MLAAVAVAVAVASRDAVPAVAAAPGDDHGEGQQQDIVRWVYGGQTCKHIRQIEHPGGDPAQG